jgi:hypothetical protein
MVLAQGLGHANRQAPFRVLTPISDTADRREAVAVCLGIHGRADQLADSHNTEPPKLSFLVRLRSIATPSILSLRMIV